MVQGFEWVHVGEECKIKTCENEDLMSRVYSYHYLFCENHSKSTFAFHLHPDSQELKENARLTLLIKKNLDVLYITTNLNEQNDVL